MADLVSFALHTRIWDTLGPNERRVLLHPAGCTLAWSRRGNRVESASVKTEGAVAHALRIDGAMFNALQIPQGVQRCHWCGCAEAFACEGGCAWITRTRCSACRSRTQPLPAVALDVRGEVPRG